MTYEIAILKDLLMQIVDDADRALTSCTDPDRALEIIITKADEALKYADRLEVSAYIERTR